MTAPCDVDALEALLADALPPERALAVQAHLRTCAACLGELDWLRTERRLMAERRSAEPSLPPDLWRAIEGRITRAAPARRPGRGPFLARLAFPVLTGAAALAAALLLYFHGPAGPEPGFVSAPPPITRPMQSPPAREGEVGGVLTVLDAALAEYEQAVAELEGDLQRSQGRLPEAESRTLDQRFGSARRELMLARADVTRDADDPDARLRALDGYADYFKSLQAAVLALEDGRP